MLQACAAWGALRCPQTGQDKPAMRNTSTKAGQALRLIGDEAMNAVLNTDTVNGGTRNTAKKERDPLVEKKRRKKSMNSRDLKQHLKYIVPEMRLALIKESGIKPQFVTSPDDLEKFVEPLKHYSEEHFVSFHLDCKFNVIGYQLVSRGTLSASLVHPREVFKAALLANSYAIIVAHNHPAGSLTPSAEDIETTQTLIKAGRILGITVLDHVIVSHTGLQSLRELKSELWFESY